MFLLYPATNGTLSPSRHAPLILIFQYTFAKSATGQGHLVTPSELVLLKQNYTTRSSQTECSRLPSRMDKRCQQYALMDLMEHLPKTYSKMRSPCLLVPVLG